jgi:hypothetical protein
MPSREQSAEAHPTRSRRHNAAIFNVHATRAPRRERGDHHDGDDAAAARLPFYTAISKRPGSSASGDRVTRGARAVRRDREVDALGQRADRARLRRSKKKLRRYQALMSREDIKPASSKDAPIQPAG